ncbi:plasmid pRiA4b ORF-3 family protein [Sporosarcina limicola]|uniref:Uncharacterized protein n=1 Tax=Sporosarcina limicola TaxID=34101 RepID=A0A927R866_9BACL|nr:plasmid pRiA4b ORF-3 family protein [Sporosarcina limicola]MBE1556694.1 hypothetical protein [Sporosarcina limicola]
MIFQFKVQLKHMSPPVWRRLQVDSMTTFHDMHEVLQTAFEWEDSHLHSFSVKRRDGKTIDNVEIGPTMNENYLFSLVNYDESKEILANWFVKEKDRIVYTYDFGDNWEHEIVLEKILSKVPGEYYPNCVKAMQLTPEEDSGWMGYEEQIEEVNWRALTEEVNRVLSPLTTVVTDEHSDSFDWKELFAQAKELNAMKPWNSLDDNQIFVVTDPVSGENLFCSVLGGGGEEFGMAVYIGDEGLQTLRDTLAGTKSAMELFFHQRSLLLSFVDRDGLESLDYDLIKKHNLTFRGKKQWIQFRSFVPGSYPWLMDEEEARLLSIVIEQAIVICKHMKQGLNIPVFGSGDDAVFIARVPKGNGKTIGWEDKLIQIPVNHKKIAESKLVISELDVKRAQKQERLNAVIEFDVFHLDMPVQVEKDERPFFPMMAVAMNHKTGEALFQEIFESSFAVENVQKGFIQFIEKCGFRPREVWVTSQVASSLAPLLKELKVASMEVTQLQHIEQLKRFLSEMKG